MSGNDVTAFPIEIEKYSDSPSDIYLCVPLPDEVVRFGIDDEKMILWEVVEIGGGEGSTYLRGEVTDEDSRLSRSVQPGGHNKAAYRVAIPKEFYDPVDSESVFSVELGDGAILELDESETGVFRVYRAKDYGPRQQEVAPKIKAPVVGGVVYGSIDHLNDYLNLPRINKIEYEHLGGEEVEFYVEFDRELGDEYSCRVSENPRISTIDSVLPRKDGSRKDFVGSIDFGKRADYDFEGDSHTFYIGLLRDGVPHSEQGEVTVEVNNSILSSIMSYFR
jgi:hypothetical protein